MAGRLFALGLGWRVLHSLILYYAAVVASRNLAEDKQSGALELVLSTPTSERVIFRGLWLAYARKMLFPVVLATLVHFFFIWQLATMAVLDPASTRVPV